MPGPKKPDEVEGVENPLEESQLSRMMDGVVNDLSQTMPDSGDMVDLEEDGVNAFEITGESQPIDQQALNEEEKNKTESPNEGAPSPFDTSIPTPKPD